jgi:Na+/H+ antiporter NhaA
MATMSDAPAAEATTTVWRRSGDTPLRRFLATETGSATVLLCAALVALVWANVSSSSYDSVWDSTASVGVGSWEVSQSLRGWVNSGLMTFFFFVVGLEARREFDIGELRERRRLVLPLAAGVGGMAVAVVTYLLVNAGSDTASGWGVAMSTDTAFALGLLALIGPKFPERMRAFLLTVVVVDDVVALVVIATAYSASVVVTALLAGVGFFALALVALRLQLRWGLLYFALGLAAWLALHESGVDPLVVGLAFGLLGYAYPAERTALEHATDLFRDFREQPTPELARTARRGLDAALSPNERLQQLWHPWTSYVIVPLFALANAGIAVDGDLLRRALTSPVTIGIVVAYVVGKPVGVSAVAWLVTRVSRGRLRSPVGWAGVLGVGATTGVPFTVSLLIATLAFSGGQLDEAKLGVLVAAAGSAVVAWTVFRLAGRLPLQAKARALLGTADPIIDLAIDVDDDRDHVRGAMGAPVTVVEYGDFECPYCGRAEPAVREMLRGHGDVRYVWRHLPLSDVHPNAQLAAEAAEAAAYQGRFWDMHDVLLAHQDALRPPDLIGYATELGLDVERFRADLRGHRGSARVAEDVEGAGLSSVSGTPTFFVNGRRHYGAYDVETLSAAVKQAKVRALL